MGSPLLGVQDVLNLAKIPPTFPVAPVTGKEKGSVDTHTGRLTTATQHQPVAFLEKKYLLEPSRCKAGCERSVPQHVPADLQPEILLGPAARDSGPFTQPLFAVLPGLQPMMGVCGTPAALKNLTPGGWRELMVT